jgi:LysM repeat protein
MRIRYLAVAAALLVAAPATASAQVFHVVAPGESLTSVAAADGLSVAALAAANGISPDTELTAGGNLVIPPQGQAPVGAESSDVPASTVPTVVAVPVSASYVVQPGDTLSAIAARSGITVAELAAANGLDPAGLLLAGGALTIPGVDAGSTAGAAEPVSQTSPAPSSSGGPYPTPVTLSGSTVGAIGADAGTSPSLTQAVGWTESGFNNDLTSDTGAVGVMQIEPETWSYINQILTPGAPLDPYSAADNVKAGALYLQSLINATGSTTLGVAAYNEGLTALREHGIYSDTQQYVNDVTALQSQFGGG